MPIKGLKAGVLLSLFASIIIALIAALHLYIAWFEMFAWTSRGPKVFRQFPKDLFEPTKALAANQGLYNAFLAVGLIWPFMIEDPIWQQNIALMFLAFVVAAGVFGALTASRKILYVQAIPAGIAILLLFLKI
ncbi:MAG: DUF1304 domain-containing protein [Sneathiellales bacterium]|nr:DUF1304 domain-containing protein [Sneathiellales bacterium]